MKKILLTICAVMISILSYSQVGISETSITADASSILELKSSTKGLLIPRMTTAERDAISSPAEGLLIFNTTTKKYNYYETTWKVMLSNIVDLTTDVTGTLPISNGGTGSSTQTAKSFTYTDVSGNITTTTSPTDGQILVGSTGNIPVVTNISTSSNILKITNGSGTIAVDANVANVALTADQTLRSTTLTNVTNFVFNIGANETWSFEFYLQNGCSGTAGLRYALVTPTGSVFRAIVFGMTTGVTVSSSSILTTSGAQTGVAFNTVILATGQTQINGSITNGGTAGTVQLQFKCGNAAQTSTIFANSYMTSRKH